MALAPKLHGALLKNENLISKFQKNQKETWM
jgi:hypothetical protein